MDWAIGVYLFLVGLVLISAIVGIWHISFGGKDELSNAHYYLTEITPGAVALVKELYPDLRGHERTAKVADVAVSAAYGDTKKSKKYHDLALTIASKYLNAYR